MQENVRQFVVVVILGFLARNPVSFVSTSLAMVRGAVDQVVKDRRRAKVDDEVYKHNQLESPSCRDKQDQKHVEHRREPSASANSFKVGTMNGTIVGIVIIVSVAVIDGGEACPRLFALALFLGGLVTLMILLGVVEAVTVATKLAPGEHEHTTFDEQTLVVGTPLGVLVTVAFRTLRLGLTTHMAVG